MSELAGPGPPDDAAGDYAIARLVGRLGGAYVLRVFQLMIGNFGDVRAGLLAEAIHTANIGHLDLRSEAGRSLAGPDGVLPDTLRRPISIARLADTTGLPFESTRRIVQGLIDAGHIVRIGGGVVMPGEVRRRPELDRMVIAQLGYTRRFIRDLQAAGIADAAAAAWTEAPSDAGEGVVARRVARVTAEYLLRALHLLGETYGDIRTGIVAQMIVAANIAHLDARPSEDWQYASIDDAPPDEVRRPVSIARLAESLGAPYETVRGQAQRLLDAGVCARVGGGLIVPRAVFEGPAAVSATLENVTYVRKLVRDLQRFFEALD